MTWKTFYDRFDSWSTATLRRHLAELTDYGPADQVIEVADFLNDANSFIKSSLQHGVVFNATDLLELDGLVTQATLEAAVRHSLANGIIFTHDELLEFDGLVSTATLTAMVKASHLSSEELLDFDGLVDESILPYPTPDEPPQQPFSLFGNRTKSGFFRPRKRRESPDDFYVAYLATNDVRVVTESVDLALTSVNADTRERRRELALERYAHLEMLKPFMDEEQLAACDPADEAIEEMNDTSADENTSADEDILDDLDDEAIPLTQEQSKTLSTIRSQLLALQSQLKAVAAGIKDADKACSVSDAAMAVDEVLMCLDEAQGA